MDVCDLGNYERGALGYNWNIGQVLFGKDILIGFHSPPQGCRFGPSQLQAINDEAHVRHRRHCVRGGYIVSSARTC